MRLTAAIVACLMLALAWANLGRAALDLAPARTPPVEIIVFEHADCVYCRVFRRDVLPRYRHAVPDGKVPLRFVDIAAGDTASLGLNARIDTLPTAVLMKDGREVDRIVGYWAPDTFFQLLSHILARIQLN